MSEDKGKFSRRDFSRGRPWEFSGGFSGDGRLLLFSLAQGPFP